MAEEPVRYRVSAADDGTVTAYLQEQSTVEGFDSKHDALAWLLDFFDQNAFRHARLEREFAERDEAIAYQRQLQRAALLEVEYPPN